jgi:hypothetical protein
MLLLPRLALLLACVAATHAALVARGSAQPSPTQLNTRSAAAAFSATATTPLASTPSASPPPSSSPLSASPPSASPSSLHAALASGDPSPPAVPASKTDGDNTGLIVGVIMSVFAIAVAAYRIKKDDGCKCKCSEYEYGAALRYLCGLPAGKGAPPSAAAASEGVVAPMLHNPMVTGSPRDPTA